MSHLSLQMLDDDRSGRRLVKLSAAWDTRLVRSARNRMFRTQPLRRRTSTSEITVRVLPLPVAITSRAFL